MRELFDEFAGKSAFDPQETVRRTTRGPQRKRFYKNVAATETAGGFGVTLDDKPIRTPSRHLLTLPTRELADIVVAEWDAQQENLNPTTMPMTRLANSVIEGVTNRAAAVADDIAKYLGTDLLFYRAEHPDALVALQAQHWDPVLRWAADQLGARFILAQGIIHLRQPEPAIAAVRATFPADPWSLAALHVATTLTGSALLALALWHRVIDEPRAWAAAHVDEDWNISQWGADDEVMARRAARRRDFDTAATVMRSLRAASG